MYKRLWPEITKAVARSDYTIDVFFEDGKTVNFDLRWLLGKVEDAHHLLTNKYYDSFQVSPYFIFWECESDLWFEIEISGGDIYNEVYKNKAKANH